MEAMNTDFTKGELKTAFIESMLKIFDTDSDSKASYLDSNNILWKLIDGKLVGKKAVKKTPYEVCWEEDL